MNNADMHLHPHPYLDLGEGESIVLIDPCSEVSEKIFELRERGEDVLRLIKDGYIELTGVLDCVTPKGVTVRGARWKNT